MVDFKFDAQVSIDRQSPEVGLVEKLSGNLYWWVELSGFYLEIFLWGGS